MNPVGDGLYMGEVVHKRLRPLPHALRYKVFSVLVDCDRLETMDRRLGLLSYNRFNLFSFCERDHGAGGPGQLGQHIEEMVRERLKSYPDLENVSMDFGSGVDSSLQVWVESVRYDRIQDIPDERIRQAVADAVEEFNR